MKAATTPPCLILSEDMIDTARPFCFERGIVPTQVVFRMPQMPAHFFQHDTLSEGYRQRLTALRRYAAHQHMRYHASGITFSVMCGTHQGVLRALTRAATVPSAPPTLLQYACHPSACGEARC